jgi:hypothetical protein
MAPAPEQVGRQPSMAAGACGGAYLVGYQHLPYERACVILSYMSGVHLSAGTMSSAVAATGSRLCPVP